MFTESFRQRNRYELPRSLAEVGIQADYPTYWYTPKILQHRYGDQMWWSVRRCVQQVLKSFRPDAVLSYFAHPDGQVGLNIARLCDVPSAVIVGGTDVLVLPDHPRRGPAVRHVLRGTTRIMTVSEGLRQRCLSLGCSPEQVRTIYQGVDPAVFHHGDQQAARQKLGLPADEQTLVWVGRMVPIKGLELLIESCVQLKQTHPRCRLHLLGDGPCKSLVQQQAAELGLTDMVHCHGAVPPEQLADWYRAADATVLSSHSEGLPNVFREALACGSPFVSTSVGSITEIADPAYSLCVNSRDPRQFGAALRTILDPAYRIAAGAYQPRTWDQCAAEVTHMFTGVLAATQPAATAPLRTPPQPARIG